MEEQVPAPNSPLDPPCGSFPGRLDDKGRLKLPTELHAYFAGLPERKLYITSLDHRLAQIYPMELWRGNLKLMNSRRDLRDAVRTIRFIAEHYGSEVEMDTQGRITLNPELRRTLGLENQGLHLNADTSGKIEIMTDALYEEERKRAERLKIEADLDILREAGLQ